MPNLKAAKKHVRQTKKRTERNKRIKHELKTLKKKLMKMIESGDKEKASEMFRVVVSKLDMAAKKKVIHKRNADRNKSKLAKKVNVLAKTQQ